MTSIENNTSNSVRQTNSASTGSGRPQDLRETDSTGPNAMNREPGEAPPQWDHGANKSGEEIEQDESYPEQRHAGAVGLGPAYHQGAVSVLTTFVTAEP